VYILCLQDVISESHRQLLADIAGFLSDSVEASTASIPTAVVALGVNLPGKTPSIDSQKLRKNLILFFPISLLWIY